MKISAKEHFQTTHGHHLRMAKIHRDGADPDRLAAEHETHAAHLAKMAECSKADAGGLEKRLPDPDQLQKMVDQAVAKALADVVRPTEVRTVIPNSFGVTMVPRAGQRQEPAKPNVDASFTKLFSVEDVDETSLLSQ